jgi:hypothetical protein
MEGIRDRTGLKHLKQKKITDEYAEAVETRIVMRVKESTYNKIRNMKLGRTQRSMDERLELVLKMRDTYLSLFSYLRKYYPDIIGEYSNMEAIRAKGKDRFKEGYVSW